MTITSIFKRKQSQDHGHQSGWLHATRSSHDAANFTTGKPSREILRRFSDSVVAAEKRIRPKAFLRSWSARSFRKPPIGIPQRKRPAIHEREALPPIAISNDIKLRSLKLSANHPPDSESLPRIIKPHATAVQAASHGSDPAAIVTPTAPEPISPPTEPEKEIAMEELATRLPESQSLRDPSSLRFKQGEIGQIESQQEDENLSQFGHEWAFISNRRMNNMSRQARIHEMRLKLREMQNRKSALEDALIQHIYRKELGAPPESGPLMPERIGLLEIVEHLREVRNLYGPLEFDVHQLEDELYREEFELQRNQDDFYQRWKFVPISTRTHGNFIHEYPPPPQSIDEKEEDGLHPLVDQYLDKKGALERLHEQLDDLLDDRIALEDTSDKRRIAGLSSAHQEQALLENTSIREDLRLQVKILEEEVGGLERECFKMNLVDEDGEPTEMANERWKDITDASAPEIAHVKPQPSTYAQFPILLPEDGMRADNVPIAFPNEEVEEKFNSRDELYQQPLVPDVLQINIWFLRTLQFSAINVKHLAYHFAVNNLNLKRKKVQEASLKNWFPEDLSTSLKKRYQPSRSSSMTTQLPRQPEIMDQLGLSQSSQSLGTSGKSSRYKTARRFRRDARSTSQTEIDDFVGMKGLRISEGEELYG